MSSSREDGKIISVGSRKSKLAQVQTEHVINCLQSVYGSRYQFELTFMETIGDKILEKPLPEIGDKGLFTAELETALLHNQVDFIVHSLKDLPTTLPTGCIIGAILQREDPTDAIVLREGSNPCSLDSVLDGSFHATRSPTIGTSSLRRQSQLKLNNPSVRLVDIRGNINTRLDKLDGKKGDVHYDAIVLATSGLKRGSFSHRISHRLDRHWYHAVGQGALAVECRDKDMKILNLLKPLLHEATILQVVAERSLLFHLEGGCSVPIGVRSSFTGDRLTLDAAVFSLDGSTVIEKSDSVALTKSSSRDDENSNHLTGIHLATDSVDSQLLSLSYDLGRRSAEWMQNNGASAILEEIKQLKAKKVAAS